MSFQPVLPLTGYVGYKFLERTLDAQQTAFSESLPIQRATDYFRENISKVNSAADLVADRQLLSVALGAFGLDEDINNTFFIRKILEDGTLADDALANRLADSRYAAFSSAFGFGDLAVANTQLSTFPDEIISQFQTQQFAKAVGAQNNDLRLALNIEDGLSDILAANTTPAGQWFSILGNPPLRTVFQTALGLPDSIVSVDLERQRAIFQERAQAVLGTDDLTEIANPDAQEDLIRLFMVRSEVARFDAGTSGSTALTLLRSATLSFG